MTIVKRHERADGRFVVSNEAGECVVIAEVGSVHDGSFGNAKPPIDVLSERGPATVKFQTTPRGASGSLAGWSEGSL